MVTKSKTAKKGRVKVGKLGLKKESVKKLSSKESKGVKAGAAIQTAGCTREVICYLK
jgi:hypothetical protein